MSTADALIEGDVRVALTDLLTGDEWTDPLDYVLADDTAEKHVGLHFDGVLRTEGVRPQCTIVQVSEIPQPAPYWGWSGDGSGPIQNMEGRIDVRLFSGTIDDLPGDESPSLLVHQLGLEVARIVRDAPGLVDPADGVQLTYDCRVNGGPTTQPDDNERGAFITRIEVGYGQFER
jgi:hypothetical protein